MAESTHNKISKLYQILSGKINNKRADYPLFEWETLLDFFLAFYDEFCNPSQNNRNKAIGMFNKLYSENVKELKNLRISKNDFEMVKTIGKGHFGEVAVVKEKNTSNVYAMKILKKAATLSQDNMAFFFEERDIMAFANSEWVTSLHYAFQDYDSLYLVMEFLPGGDFLSLLNRYEDSMVDEETCRFYLSEIIIAVNCVHKIGYVHRDIKPENILIDLTGHIKLADFGSAARLVNGKQVFGKMPVGTPEYIAPEVLTSMDSGGGKYGVGCDYWSVGVVMYEMLFGCLPFESDSVLQLYNQIMNFEKNLEFPDDVEIKPETRDIINGLICHQSKRMGYNALAQHEFFKNLDWTTIKSMPPPHVPVVTSRTDTSNFDDINTPSVIPGKSGVQKTNGFCASNFLPFVGFSFTRSLKHQLDDDTTKSMNDFLNKTTNVSAVSTSVAGPVSGLCAEDRKSTASIAISPETQEAQQNIVFNDLMMKENKSLAAELENAKKDLERAKKDLTASQSETTRVEADKEFYAQETEKLKTRYKELSALYDSTVQQSGKINLEGQRLVSELFSIFDCSHNLILKDGVENGDIVEQVKAEYVKLKQDREEATQKVHDLTSEIAVLNYKVELLTKNIKDNEDRYNASCGELRDTVSTLQATLEQTTQSSQSTITSMKQSATESEKQIKSLNEQLERLRLSASALQIQQQQQQQQQRDQDPKVLGDLQSDLNSANSSVNSLKSENSLLVEKLAKSDEENVKLRNDIIAFETSVELFVKELNSAESSAKQLKTTLADKNLTISELNEKISHLERTLVEVKCQQEMLSTKLKSKEQTTSDLEKKVQEMKCDAEKHKYRDDTDVKALTDQLNLANHKVASLTAEIEDKTSSEEFYRNSTKTSQAEVLKLSAEIKQLESTNCFLEGAIKKLKDTIHTQKVSNYSLTELVEKLREDIASARNETRQVSNDFEEYKAGSHEEYIRLTETVKQQDKLIEFLQKLNEKSKKPSKSESRDESHYGTFDSTSKLKKDRTKRLIKSRKLSSKHKQPSIGSKESGAKSTNSRSFAISKDSYTITNTFDEINESCMESHDTQQNSTMVSGPLCDSTNSSVFNSTTNVDAFMPCSVSHSQTKASRLSELTSVTGSTGHTSTKRWSKVDQQLPAASKYAILGGGGGDSGAAPSSVNSVSDESLVFDPTRHNFIERLNLCKIVCMVCYNVIQFGTLFKVCKVCFLRCHSDCCESVYVQCVLGCEYDWFCYTPTVAYCTNYFSTLYNYSVPVMGWVSKLTKVIKTKTEWEQLWLVATNNSLSLFKHSKTADDISNQQESDPDLIESYSFLPGEFSVHINVRTSETLTYAGTTDSRTYWCVKLNSKSNPVSSKKTVQSSSLLFSTPLQDKTYWVAMLSRLFNQYTAANKTIQLESQKVHFVENLDTKNLLNICHTLTLNNDVSLIATSNELFIYASNHGGSNQKGGHLIKLNGFNFVMGMTKVKDNVFIICGKSRLLIKIEAKVLMNELKSKTPTTFDDAKFGFSTFIRNCHMVKAGKCNGEYYVAVGIGSRLILLKPSNGNQFLDVTFGAFIKNIHFTSIGIIYQTDIIHILNIKTGEIKNFFDPNDTSLSVQIFGQKSSYNYFLDVFTLKTKKNHEEFLFCYSELGIVVNKDGKRSRNIDIVWPDVPTEFHIVGKHLLCVCYYDRIDLYDLTNLHSDSDEFKLKSSYPVLSPSIIHQTPNSIHVCASDTDGNFGLYRLDLR